MAGVVVGGRGEGELPMLEHVAGVAGSEVACLGTEVQEDGIRLPAAQGADGSFVDTGDEEQRCCSPGSQAVGFDTVRGMCVMCSTSAAAARSSAVMSAVVICSGWSAVA
jgi:hypothetical protein